MENIVYNDLVIKGYSVDVGVLDMYEQNKNGKSVLKRTEVDFVATKPIDVITYRLPNRWIRSINSIKSKGRY